MDYLTDFQSDGALKTGIDTDAIHKNRITWIDEEGNVIFDSHVAEESLENHNSSKAFQQVGDFLNENRGIKNNNSKSYTNENPFLNPFSMKYNPIRNQYMNQNNSENSAQSTPAEAKTQVTDEKEKSNTDMMVEKS